jgi:transcriptional regulator with XRE-family HTH domain
MPFNETFGECLKKLLKIMNLKGSALAKGINVDPSLVYKWLRNVRVPSYSSYHIDSITDFLMKCIINSFQHTKIINALKEYGFEIADNDPKNLQNALRAYLFEAQGYSIEVLANNSISDKEKFQSKVKDLVKPLSMPPDTAGNERLQKNADGSNVIELTELNPFFDPTRDSDKIKIIRGNKDVLDSALALLQSAPSKPNSNDDIILIALNSSTNKLFDYREYGAKWKHAILTVLSRGWTIVLLVKSNSDRNIIVRLVEILQSALVMGKLRIYYCNRNDTLAVNELFAVPKRGALYCFSSKLTNQLDSAFLFRSKLSIRILSEHYCQFFSSARPLLREYPSCAKAEFQLKITESEENLGNRYYFNGGISAITIPMSLYEKYLKMKKISKQEALLWLDYHRRRLTAFETQIQYYKYKDIWLKEAVEMLIHKKKYSFSNDYILENCIPDNEDIVCHLENIVNMLELYENYEVALVGRNDCKDACGICWMVKENSGAFIKAIKTSTQKGTNFDFSDSGVNAQIAEKEVISAFEEYFKNVWNEIKFYEKQNGKLVKWLKIQIASLKKKVM